MVKKWRIVEFEFGLRHKKSPKDKERSSKLCKIPSGAPVLIFGGKKKTMGWSFYSFKYRW